jgi:hypothetical protein
VALRLAPATERAVGARTRLARLLAGVVAGLALLAAGFGLGRVSAARPLPVPAVAAPSAPSGQERAPAAPVVVQGPGPARYANDIGVGFARTEAGAVAAATGYLEALGDKRAFDADWRERAYRTIADPAVADELITSVEESYQRVDDELGLGDGAAYNGSVLAVTVPVGYRVDQYDEDRAVVTVWAAGWLTQSSGPELPLRAQTATVELVWVDGDWKLAGVTGIQPLDPPGVAAPVTAQALAEMRGFNAYDYRPQEQP